MCAKASLSQRDGTLRMFLLAAIMFLRFLSAASQCGQVYSGNATIMSYLLQLPPGESVSCTWRFIAQPRHGNVTLTLICSHWTNYSMFTILDANGKRQEIRRSPSPPGAIIVGNSAQVTYTDRFSNKIQFTMFFATTTVQSEASLRGSGEILSPGFPGYYPSNIFFCWRIRSLTDEGSLVLKFKRLNIRPSGDRVIIYQNDRYKEILDGSNNYRVLNIYGNYGSNVTIIFVSGASVNTNYEGFEIEFFSIPYQWGTVIVGQGVIQERHTPQPEYNNTTYIWMLRAEPKEGNVTLVIKSMDMTKPNTVRIHEPTGQIHELSYSAKPVTALIMASEVNVTFCREANNVNEFEIDFITTTSQFNTSMRGSGRVTSPGYPNYLPQNTYLQWTLHAFSNESSILLHFRNFSAYEQALFVFDERGKLLRLTGSSLWPIELERSHFGRTVTIIFVSNNFRSISKFDIEFFTIPFQWSITYTGRGRLTGYDIPHIQSDNVTFLWMLRSWPENGNITLLVTHMKVDVGDRFQITDATGKTRQLSHLSKPSTTVILSGEANVTFFSPYGTTKSFDILFRTTRQHSEYDFYGSGQNLSFGHSRHYSGNTYTRWTLHASAGYAGVLLKFRFFSFWSDLIIVTDSHGKQMELFKYGGWKTPNRTDIFGDTVSISFFSDESENYNDRRFLVDFLSVGDKCGGSYIGDVVISSPSSPTSSSTVCTWLLRPSTSYYNMALLFPLYELAETDEVLITNSRGLEHRFTRTFLPPPVLLLANVSNVTFSSRTGGTNQLEVFVLSTYSYRSLSFNADIRRDFTYSRLHRWIFRRFEIYHRGETLDVFAKQWNFHVQPLTEIAVLLFYGLRLSGSDRLLISDITGQQQRYTRDSRLPTALMLASTTTVTLLVYQHNQLNNLIPETTIAFFKTNSSCEHHIQGSGTITLPEHSESYIPRGAYCRWYLRAWPDYEIIRIRFLSPSVLQQHDLLTITDNLGKHYVFTGTEPQTDSVTLDMGKLVNITIANYRFMQRSHFQILFFSAGATTPTPAVNLMHTTQQDKLLTYNPQRRENLSYTVNNLHLLSDDSLNDEQCSTAQAMTHDITSEVRFSAENGTAATSSTAEEVRAETTLASEAGPSQSTSRLTSTFSLDGTDHSNLQHHGSIDGNTFTNGSSDSTLKDSTFETAFPYENGSFASKSDLTSTISFDETEQTYLQHREGSAADVSTNQGSGSWNESFDKTTFGQTMSKDSTPSSSLMSINGLPIELDEAKPSGTCRQLAANHTFSARRYPLGTVLNASCSAERPLIAWRCTATSNQDAEWRFDRQYNCTSTHELAQLAKANFTFENASNIFKKIVSAATAPGTQFGVAVTDVEATSSIFSNVIRSLTERPERVNFTEIGVEATIIIDRILRAPADSVATSSAASNVSQSFELLLAATAEMLEVNKTTHFVEENLYAQVTSDPDVIGLEVTRGGSFTNNNVKPILAGSDTTNADTEAQIFFARSTKELRKTFAVYNNDKLFQGKNMYPANDKILSAQLSKAIAHDELVTMHLRLPPTLDMDDSSKIVCGFWSYADNDWSTVGCTKKNHVSSRVVCSCNHTTNFAVLMRIAEPASNEVHQAVLSTITRIGLSVSIALLLVVIVSYLLFRKLRKRMTQKVHFHLCVSILLLDIIFLVGIERTENQQLCIAFAALLHTLLLASFGWMSAEATLQYLRFVKVVFAVPQRFHVYSALLAWGLPVVITAALLIVDIGFYDTRNEGLCWVQKEVLHYAVFLPISLSIVFNGVMFAYITKTLLTSKAIAMSSSQSKSRRRKLHLQGCFSVFVLMGLTWTFAFFAFDKAELVFHYLFCIFNSAQGAAIAIFHVLTVKLVWQGWRRLLMNRRYDEVSSAGTSYRSNSTKYATSFHNEQSCTRL